ncbi:McrC family protein [Paraburkholderia sp. MMS20-SJTN17]|uniref:McrC family protein n=1 Tax=Paraburkholderia translucens TaxID=2886945 RepID=A0ABS8KB67_9BURK|nr:McrC family protein [Paraburkholderia sp. MMS20-SJTN17]MCC8402020.1 McrC family protein [Paraburkholderia sp. MMS20-SJTN17]
MNILSVREYDTLPVVETLDQSDARALTHRELDALDAVGSRLGIRIAEQISRRQVRFQQYVGLVMVDGRIIELLPKIESDKGEQVPSMVRHNLLRMLLTAFDTNVHVPDTTNSQETRGGWLDVFIRVYCEALSVQVRKGIVKRYRLEQDNLFAVRGQVLLGEQIARNLVHQERIVCEFDELDTDHELNQSLKLALSKMTLCCFRASTQRKVRELLANFESVSRRAAADRWWDAIELDRLSARYQGVLRMTQFFLNGFSPDIIGGGAASMALVFDMSVLFERYIGRVARMELSRIGLQVHLQQAKHYLTRWCDSGQQTFLLRPDIVVTRAHRTVCIADTKWKRLTLDERRMGISQSDLYQMLAYADRYSCDRIVLLYPFERFGDPAVPASRLLAFEERKTRVLIGQVMLSDLETVPGQLRTLLSSIVEEMG